MIRIVLAFLLLSLSGISSALELKVGKKYAVRDPRAAEVQYVIILYDINTLPNIKTMYPMIGIAVEPDKGRAFPVSYTREGSILGDIPRSDDIVGEYGAIKCNCEKEIDITVKGKRYKLVIEGN